MSVVYRGFSIIRHKIRGVKYHLMRLAIIASTVHTQSPQLVCLPVSITMSRLDISFPTLDGLTIRGWIYPASKRGPGIIVSPGVSELSSPRKEERPGAKTCLS